MVGSFLRLCKICSVLLAVTLALPNAAAAEAESTEIVVKAQFTVQKILKDPDVGPTVRRLMKDAKAVLIFPNVLKAAFFIGGEGGSGVLLARGANGNWSYPAFFTLGAASFGIQIGGQSSEVMLLIMTNKGITSVVDTSVKLGADLSVAAGPIGVGAEASTTTNLGADIYSFSRNQGAYFGASFEGAIIGAREDWNTEYYKSAEAKPHAIIFDGKFANPQADALRKTLAELK